MKKLIIILALILTASIAQAAFVIDLGDLGTLTIPDRVVPATKTVLERAAGGPLLDENEVEIPRTNVQFKALLLEYLRQHGTYYLKRAVLNQLNAERAPENVDDITTE